MKVKNWPWSITSVFTFTRCLIVLGVSAAACVVFAETYFAAPDGSDSNPGTMERPFGSLRKGCEEASAGDTVYFRGGTYRLNSGISIRKSGCPPVVFWRVSIAICGTSSKDR